MNEDDRAEMRGDAQRLADQLNHFSLGWQDLLAPAEVATLITAAETLRMIGAKLAHAGGVT
jgi:hypothetical protein